jgi:hypothetical protein
LDIPAAMETIIKVRPAELNEKLLIKIREFIGDNDSMDIIISLTDANETYEVKLNQSIRSAEKGSNLVNFTMEEFMAYTPGQKSGE